MSISPEPRNWIAVASAEHVRIGRAQGFMQVCHGKGGPLRRIAPGDRVAYYSSSERMGARDGLQCLTAFGLVEPGPVIQADMGGGFLPFRRPVRWLSDTEVPIRPLLEQPGFALSGPAWGARLRFGLLQVDAASMAMIADAMGVALPTPDLGAGARHQFSLPLRGSRTSRLPT